MIQDHVVEKEAYRIVDKFLEAKKELWGVCFSDYQPGNGTSYKLVFLRVGPRPGQTPVWGFNTSGEYVLVSWLEHACYPFSILPASGQWHVDPGYLAEHFHCRMPDAEAISALLDEISRQWTMRRPVVEYLA